MTDQIVKGSTRNDSITTESGNDQVTSNGGHDIIFTKSGNDKVTLLSDSMADLGSGDDTAIVWGDDNHVYGNDGDDNIKVVGERNYVEGGKGDDTFIARSGNQTSMEIGDFGRGADELIITGFNQDQIRILGEAISDNELQAIQDILSDTVTFSDKNVSYDDLEISQIRYNGDLAILITHER